MGTSLHRRTAASCSAGCVASRDVVHDRSQDRPPSSCVAFEAGGEVDAARLALSSARADEIAMLGQRVADAAAVASSLRGAVALACRRIAVDLGTAEAAIRRIDADESATARAKAACGLAADALRRNKRGLTLANAAIPSCRTDVEPSVLPALLARCRPGDDACSVHARRAAELRQSCGLAPSAAKATADTNTAVIDAPAVLVVAGNLRGRRWADRIVATADAANLERIRGVDLSRDERMCLATFAETAEGARVDTVAAIEAAKTVLDAAR
jgi:hypothetical protein